MWQKVVVVLISIVVLCSCVIAFNPNYEGRDSNADIEDSNQSSSLTLELNALDEENVYHDLKTAYFYKYSMDESPDEFRRMLNDNGQNSSYEEGDSHGKEPNFKPWSVLWYAGSFGGLIAFFLVVSCSEWCCRAQARNARASSPGLLESSPPPSYDLFAPPSYESLCSVVTEKKSGEYGGVFVVPVALPISTASPAIVCREQLTTTTDGASSQTETTQTSREVLVDVVSAQNNFCSITSSQNSAKQLRENATQT